MRVEFTASHLEAFARQWSCFGEVTGEPLAFAFDRNGDLCDVAGDDGLDPSGVLALSHDAAALAGLDLEGRGTSDLAWLAGLERPLVEP